MRSKNKKRKPPRWKSKLLLPDLDNAKAAVLASHHSPESQRSYRHAIDEFVGWYCSEPRLSFNKTVVTRYRIHFEDRRLAAGTTNVRLAAVRRLADEAADAGLLSPELAAGIRRVKGSKRLGIRLGDWLTAEQARSLWQLPNTGTLKSKRDRAILPPPLPPEIQRPRYYVMLLAKFSPPQPAGLKCVDQLLHFCTAPPLLNSPKGLFFSHSPT